MMISPKESCAAVESISALLSFKGREPTSRGDKTIGAQVGICVIKTTTFSDCIDDSTAYNCHTMMNP